MTSIDISFDVQARSTFHLPDHVTVVVNISDVNDNKPVFSNGTYSFTIAENAATGATVGQVKASDADQVSNTGTIDYGFDKQLVISTTCRVFRTHGVWHITGFNWFGGSHKFKNTRKQWKGDVMKRILRINRNTSEDKCTLNVILLYIQCCCDDPLDSSPVKFR